MKKTEKIRVDRNDDSGALTLDIIDALTRLGIDVRITKDAEDVLEFEVAVDDVCLVSKVHP